MIIIFKAGVPCIGQIIQFHKKSNWLIWPGVRVSPTSWHFFTPPFSLSPQDELGRVNFCQKAFLRILSILTRYCEKVVTVLFSLSCEEKYQRCIKTISSFLNCSQVRKMIFVMSETWIHDLHSLYDWMIVNFFMINITIDGGTGSTFSCVVNLMVESIDQEQRQRDVEDVWATQKWLGFR